MHSEVERDFGLDVLSNLQQQYGGVDSKWKVKSRWLLYDFAEELVDMEAAAVEALQLDGHEVVADIGASDGAFSRRLRTVHEHDGPLIAVEPFIEQYTPDPTFNFSPEEVSCKTESRYGQEIREIARHIAELILQPDDPDEYDVSAINGTANHLGLRSGSLDVLTAMFMLYHIPNDKRAAAIQEFKRTLKPGGVFVMATSGTSNKLMHRMFESVVADALGVQKPQTMNEGFTTEIAAKELPLYFENVHALVQETDMVISDDFGVITYLNSQITLRDQYTPVPGSYDFEAVLAKEVGQPISLKIQQTGVFRDFIRRSLFVCSDDELFIPSRLGFKKIK